MESECTLTNLHSVQLFFTIHLLSTIFKYKGAVLSTIWDFHCMGYYSFTYLFDTCTQVDTHIHASSSMNHKHLLRFIKKKMRTEHDVVVAKDKATGRMMTLGEVCGPVNISRSQN